MDFEVKRADLHETRVVESTPATLGDGEARLAVRRFGFSANNITYAVFGDIMQYWTFFPAEDGWGRIPVWGFAEVLEAGSTGLTEGELVYGYLPMGSELIVTPTRVSEHGFHDASAHRAELPPAYNGYTRCAADPVYHPETEALQMLFRPLFMTDFVLDDWLADNGFFDAGVVVLSSASSKTAFGLAHLLALRSDGAEIIGLTSEGNVEFVEGLGVYDRVLTYDDVDFLTADEPTVYVDMAGDAAVRRAVHEHVTALAASVQVGGTHWENVGGDGPIPGPEPKLFFAPDQIVKRRADWGPRESRNASPRPGRGSWRWWRTGSRSSSGPVSTTSARPTSRCSTARPTRATPSCSRSIDGGVMDDLAARRLEVVRLHMASENVQDFDTTMSTFAHPRYELIPTGQVFDGEEAVRGYFAGSRATFADQRNEPIALHTTDAGVFAEFWLLGTHTGPLLGHQPTGREIRVRMVAFFEFPPGKDGIICERVYYDVRSILDQLGLEN